MLHILSICGCHLVFQEGHHEEEKLRPVSGLTDNNEYLLYFSNTRFKLPSANFLYSGIQQDRA